MRKLLQASHLTGELLILLALLVTCAPTYRPGLPPESPFTEHHVLVHGVATGDVTSHSALVWFRTAGRANVQVQWLPQDGSALPASSESVLTDQQHDFTGTVQLKELTPATPYRYEVSAQGLDHVDRMHLSGWFRTPAADNVSEPVTFVWSGDVGGQGRCRDAGDGYPIFDRILAVKPAFALLLGDTIYGDEVCPSPPNAPGGDFVATTLDQFRAKHRYQRAAQALQRFLSAVPVYTIWDDHEVRNNFSGQHDPLMPVGRQALLEYWPISTPPDDPHRLYRQIRRGADAEFFILDTRQYRSRNAEPDGPGKTMLGSAQRDWLLAGLARSTATWKLIATSVPLSNPKNGTPLVPGNDSWARAADGTGFQTELRGIVQTILDRKIRNVVWLAGDVHYAQVNAYDPNGDGVSDFHEFICGPLSAGPNRPVPPDPTFGPTTFYSEGGFSNFGLVTVDGISLRLRIMDGAGGVRFERTFSAQ
ncbi:MAG TPA: alkaline phosphatase D family protein [Nitrospiraceae bacterium]|nr:alkaline phosphatase D family protein [Nitrospiraceae bacterium]